MPGAGLKIWQVMLGGALAVLLLGQISVESALHAINYDVIIFLSGAFVVGSALSLSGALNPAIDFCLNRFRSPAAFFTAFIFGAAALSSVLMNDTVAVIGTFFAASLSRRMNIPRETILLALAFSVTTGSVASPVGNPQNLLIASDSGMVDPFYVFGIYLLVPTVISLLLIYPVLRFFYPFLPAPLGREPESPVSAGTCGACDKRLSRIAVFSLAIFLVMILLKITAGIFLPYVTVPLTLIAIAGALPVIILSKRRTDVLKGVDWGTLVFFASMFVLMQSVWDSGFFQEFIDAGSLFSSPFIIFSAGLILSQLISNVPFVALFMPAAAASAGSSLSYAALAAGSTLAGNLLIFGAASNIIIVQNAGKTGGKVGFFRFAKAGVPLTLLQSAVYLIYFYAVFS
ncbi:Na+/H+ antiporter NhaD/arsenite permease-like protein [Methanomicrobium sp. W14]|uniref:SLC13 family permease n=1 Tax=Methanomicrobium sp. W14 TaxID=2817839 RepID=UPI0032AEC45E|nr:Na+/H+ antiporter NhaD/arsenite permease-like protein [Methanomicrobium sp. W14]